MNRSLGSQRHTNNRATVGNGPVHAGKNTYLCTYACICQYFTNKDGGFVTNAIAGSAAGRCFSTTGGTGNMRTVTIEILHRLANKRMANNRTAHKIGMAQIKPGV